MLKIVLRLEKRQEKTAVYKLHSFEIHFIHLLNFINYYYNKKELEKIFNKRDYNFGMIKRH